MKTGRNEPCPCGSGRKYKHCCHDKKAPAPGLAASLYDHGTAQQHRGDLEGAAASYLSALALRPDFVECHVNLGNVRQDQGRQGDAIACFRAALTLRPQFTQVHLNLGLSLQAEKRFNEAIASYKAALAQAGPSAHILHNLGIAQRQGDQLDAAIASFEAALALDDRNIEIHQALGETLRAQGRLNEAEGRFRAALTIDANATETLYSLANTLLDQDQFARAQEIYRQILTLRPEHSEAHTNLLFSMNFTGQSVAEYVAEARRYGRMVSTLAGTLPACDPGRKGGAPLRVGLVSGDLREHPVGHFLEGTIANLDRSRVELIAYSTFNVDDAVSARMRSHFSKWTLLPKGDKAAAQMIRADGIDILVDLAGHTGNNRLPLFAWRPAPVQASWLGYFASTGVEQMDYFIADPITTPETHRSAFTEQVWHLPCTRLCFTAPDIHVPVSDLPALSDGVVTFGCFNSLSKMNESVVGVWARLLHAAPQSRLFLKAKQFKSAAVRAQVLARFQDHAIPAHRLVLEGPSTRAEYLAAYGRVDIGLDPFPFTGATTTAESLWMGVPVLTLAGDRLVARQGMGLLTNAGLGNWIATDEDDYIGRAVALASDLPRLALLRAGLRSQVRQSPLFDGARLARDLEDALERMWDVHAATRHFEGRVSGAA